MGHGERPSVPAPPAIRILTRILLLYKNRIVQLVSWSLPTASASDPAVMPENFILINN